MDVKRNISGGGAHYASRDDRWPHWVLIEELKKNWRITAPSS